MSALSTSQLLTLERARASFNARELTYFIDGGEEETATRERVMSLLAHDVVMDKSDDLYLSREDLFARSVERSVHAFLRCRALGLSEHESELYLSYTRLDLPLYLHRYLFIPTLESQASKSQQAAWLPEARALRWWGCYLQTEMKNGSNVAGLTTTATYDREADEFVIHSPTLESRKWWPGALGVVCSHGIVYARLMVDGKYLGMHSFLVQLRSLEDHTPMKGIEIGELGPKLGFAGVDNGFCAFHHVRVPRSNMLMGISRLSADGEYSTRPHLAKLAYATMLKTRCAFVRSSHYALAHAATIAVRYSLVRTQFASREKDTEPTHIPEEARGELQILDYTTQQFRVLPLLATAYALRFAGLDIVALFDETAAAISSSGDVSGLPRLHALASGIKSLYTRLAADGIEELRRSCGGHGYLESSGLPRSYTSFVHTTTAEGDSYVMSQQFTRFLLKGGNFFGSSVQPKAFRASAARDFLSVRALIGLLQSRALSMLHRLKADLASQSWNASLVEVHNTSDAFAFAYLAQSFAKAVDRSPNEEIKRVLTQLCALMILHHLETVALADLLEFELITPAHVRLIKQAVRQLLKQVRVEAAGLADAFNFSDYVLDSTLGRSDGRVYEALAEHASRSPMNQHPVHEPSYKHLKKVLKSKL